MKKKGKKSLALAMTLAVTVTSVPPVYAADAAHTPMILPELSDGENAKAVSWKYEKLDQAPMKESVQASSENTPEQYSEGPAKLAFDGTNTTAWHTNYSTHQGPYWIQWDLGNTYTVGKIDYTRKADGANGTWKSIKVEAQKADGTWVEACTKELEETAMGATTEITFDPVEAKALKVTVNDSYNKEANNKYASAGEINVYKATKDVTLVDPIKVVAEKTTMKEGETQQLQYKLTQEAEEVGGKVKWRVTDNDVIKVDENGLLTAVGEGKRNVNVEFIVGDKTYSNYAEITVERVETECKINLNGTDYTANSLEEAVKAAGLTELTSVKFESGVIREEDFDFLKKFNRIQYTLKEFSIGDDVVLRGLAGNKIPVNAFYKNTSGYALNTVYLGKNVKGLESQAFAYCKELTSFVAPGLESMHDNALNRVNKLPELNLPSLKAVENYIFAGKISNTATKTIKLPSVAKLDNEAFYYLKNLETLELGTVPPEVSSNFKFKDSQVETKLVIPDGALDAYKASPGYNAENNTWYGIKLPDAQEEVAINVTVNDKAVEGASLEKAVTASGVALADIDSVTINSGKVTQDDLAYLKTIPRMETFEMTVGENLQLIGKDGNPTTVLSNDTAVIEFAGKPSGSSRATMTTLTLGGITEIYYEGLKGYSSIETISMPDVITVGERAFCLGDWLETLDLSSAKTIGANAFNGCKRLETLTMNAVETLGEGSFKYTDALDELTLPATIKTIEDIRFGVCKNGNKSGAKIKILASTPPTVDNGAFNGVSSVTRQATVTVPNGALAAYVAQVNPSADVTKILKNTDINWQHLYLREEESYMVTYSTRDGKFPVYNQYAYVAADGQITADKLADLSDYDKGKLGENEEFKGWNTKKTGDGDMITAETVVSTDMTVYPVIGEKAEEINITATVNDGEAIGAENLAKVIEKAGVDSQDVETVTVDSGTVTPEDLATLKGLKYLTNLELNLDEDLKMVDTQGAQTTVLPNGQFTGSKLETVSLNGFTEIGASAFARSNDLETVVMSDVVTIGEAAFEETSVEVVTLPASIKSIGRNAFVGKRNGKREMHVTIEATTPPTIDGSFAKHEDADVTVPDGCLGNYINLDLSKPFGNSGDTKWGGLRVIDHAQNLITYHGVNSWDVMYAYVEDNTAITEGRFPTTFENDGKILSGWNTAEDGSGTAVDANTVVTEEMTLYAQWSDPAADLKVTASCSNDDGHGGAKWTNEDVTVTLTANKAINDIEGWTRVSETELTKVHSENGTYQVTVTSADNQQAEVKYVVKHIDKQAPNVSVKGTGNGENYREITAIAVHDTKGVRYLTINGVKTKIDDKYEYLTDIEKLGVIEGENTATVVDKAGNEKSITFYYDKTAPVIDYKAIEAANGYKREIPVNEGEEYTEEQLVKMFTKPEWVTDNSGHAEFKVDKWGLEHGLDGYKPFTSKTPGTYKVRFYAYDAAGNSSTFDVYVKVLEPETPEERTTTVNYTVFLDNGVRTGTWTHTGTEEGTFEFEVSMTGLDLEGYVPAEGETGSRTLTYGETTSVTFYLVSE